MLQRAINDYFLAVWASKSKIWKDKLGVIYIFNLGVWPMWSNSLWVESDTDIFRYVFFLIALYSCMPVVRVVEKGLPKVMQLCPMNKTEKMKYMYWSIVVQIIAPLLIGFVSISIAMLLCDGGWNVQVMLTSIMCIASIGIGKNAFPSYASNIAKVYKYREVAVIVVLIIVAIVNIIPYACGFVDACVGMWKWMYVISFFLMIVLDIWAIRKMIPREVERCVVYAQKNEGMERTVNA